MTSLTGGRLPYLPRPQLIRPKIGQLAFQAFDIEPQGLAATEHQYRAAAGRLGRMKLDPNQFQHIVGCGQIDIA